MPSELDKDAPAAAVLAVARAFIKADSDAAPVWCHEVVRLNIALQSCMAGGLSVRNRLAATQSELTALRSRLRDAEMVIEAVRVWYDNTEYFGDGTHVPKLAAALAAYAIKHGGSDAGS